MKPINLIFDIKRDMHDYVELMQGYSYSFECEFYDDGIEFDLTGYNMSVDMLLANGDYDFRINSKVVSGNKVTFNTDVISGYTGDAKLQILLDKSGTYTGSWLVDCKVKPSVLNEVKNTDFVTDLKQTIQEGKDLYDKGGVATKQDIAEVNTELSKKVYFYDFEKETEKKFKLNRCNKNGDWFGFNSINVIGDSISHGANAQNQVDDSYIGILRKMFQVEFNTTNYGFEKMLSTIYNANGEYKGAHDVETIGEWDFVMDQNTIGMSSYSSVQNGSKLRIKLNINDQKYCKIIFNGQETGGNFKFYLEHDRDNFLVQSTRVQSLGANKPYCSEKELTLSSCNESGEVVVVIEKLDGDIVKIDGVQYFNNVNDVMVQNYARSGAKLIDVNDDLIKLYASCNMAIFALGHNDIISNSSIEEFKFKIDRFSYEFKVKGVDVVVLDFGWYWGQDNPYKQELRRLADETNGIYIDFNRLYGNDESEWKKFGFLSDYSHPSEYGHKLIAEISAREICLGITSKNAINKIAKYIEPLVFGGFSIGSGSVTLDGNNVFVSLEVAGNYINGDKVLKLPNPNIGVNILGFARGERNGNVDFYPQSFFLDGDGVLTAYTHQITNVERTVLNFSYRF